MLKQLEILKHWCGWIMQNSFVESLINNIKDVNEQAKKRAYVCDSCDKRNLGVCTECGCFLEIKVRLPNATCPLNKWIEETNV